MKRTRLLVTIGLLAGLTGLFFLLQTRARAAVTRPGNNLLWHYCKVTVTNRTNHAVAVTYKWQGAGKWRNFRRSLNPGSSYTREMPIGGGFKTRCLLHLKAQGRGLRREASSVVSRGQTYVWTIRN